MIQNLAVLNAPSNLGLMPPAAGKEPGVSQMSLTLKRNGIVQRLGATDAGTVSPLPYVPDRDSGTGVRNAHSIRAYTPRLADAIEALIQEHRFPIVLGGDCSILLGGMLALRRLGDYGLIFIDGHRDFQTPETSATGGAAGMDLALATGRGPAELTRFDTFDALVREDATVVLGHRDVGVSEMDGSRAIFDTSIRLLDLDEVRRLQPARAAEEALSSIESSGVRGYWVHLDADVLDSTVMPAVDSPEPGGMTYDELQDLIVPLLNDDRAMGLEITIYDPSRDPDGDIGRQFTDWIVDLFRAERKAV